jgi:hypothetical protein
VTRPGAARDGVAAVAQEAEREAAQGRACKTQSIRNCLHEQQDLNVNAESIHACDTKCINAASK